MSGYDYGNLTEVCVPLHSQDIVKRVSITIKPFRNQFHVSIFYQGLNLIVYWSDTKLKI